MSLSREATQPIDNSAWGETPVEQPTRDSRSNGLQQKGLPLPVFLLLEVRTSQACHGSGVFQMAAQHGLEVLLPRIEVLRLKVEHTWAKTGFTGVIR